MTQLGTAPLPGMEDNRIEEVRSAALEHVDVRDQRKALKEREDETKERLLEVMHEHGISYYFDAEAKIRIDIEEGAEKVVILVGEAAKAQAAATGDPVDLDNPDEDEPIKARTMKPAKKKTKRTSRR